ncbi:MAG: alpha/beta hydrolase fold domain-containing protein [Bacteroidetes bacterium]|nr:alpha/beta hydrolase fold domain-containing protein [Bacteroidota bacterium]
MKKKWICLVVISLFVTMAFAQTKEEKLAGWLKKFPEADANKDGVLTEEEASAFRMKLQAKTQKEALPAPTHADLSYGPDPMNVLDLWLVPSDRPTPLLVCIHGGGFRGGDKSNFRRELIENMNREGISVASINYRLTKEGLLAEGENMYPVPMHDGARALQYLRYNATKYNLDKSRFAATGGSAGGCMLMWLGFHPELAQANHKDPVLRESSRLQVLAPRGGQSSVHGPTFLEWFGVKSLNLGKKKGEVQSSIMDDLTAEQLALSLDASPITHLTPDDPPIYLYYGAPNEPVDETTLWGTWVHHPMLGIKLKEAMEVYLGMECHLEYKGGPPVTAYESQQDFIIRKLKSLPSKEEADALKWKTTGLKQANSMGAGEAAIPKNGKFRVFVLMGQSNMQGAGRANELKAPYTEKHDRIRIWANGRWEYFVPSQRFGPGVSLAHQLAGFWPEDQIGIIKVASGGTGICGFEKDWSFERAELTYDGKKGSLYKDLENAIAEAKRISQPEFCGFVWKQGGADGTKKELATAYYDRLYQLISDLRTDLGTPDLPVFIPSYLNDRNLLKAILSGISEEELSEAKQSAGDTPENDEELLKAVLSYLNDRDPSELRKSAGKRPYITTVIAAQNRAGREIPNVTTLYPGRLPIGDDGTHYSSEGYIMLGKITASAIEEFYKAKE